ncbi:conjugal transfer protein TraD [Brucella pituitosa]|uniref:conjugal transfer protein TraD n=1 Tax=Brucella pituitosa TaxID=571256 RepID=UPI000C2759C1|nr:hypothetical protein CWE02_06210 [Brucella pituitosa]
MEHRLLRPLKNSASDKTAQRKHDARQKIELGGLLIKAGHTPLHSPERQSLTMTGRSELAAQGKHE